MAELAASGARPDRRSRPRRGVFVVIAGPDGAGKGTILEALIGSILTGRLLGIHHRPRFLGGLAEHDGAPVTDPHGGKVYPRWLSTGKLLFLYLDHLLGYAFRILPWLRGGGDVVMERGWWDLLVDPRRYRLRPAPRLVRVLGTLLPRPDATFALGGDAATIAERKGELSVEETARQLEVWRSVPRRLARTHHLDVCRPVEEVVSAADQALARGRAGRWIGLPTRTSPRWIVPDAPPRVASGALGLYNPVTPRGRVAWEAARRVARLGGFRLLRTHTIEPPRDVLDLLEPHLPPGARVAVANGNHPGRRTALVLDGRSGVPLAFAKVASDVAGAHAIRDEVIRGQRLAPWLPPGLSAPRVLHHEEHMVLFEAVGSVPRPRPWALAPDLAELLGRFFRNGSPDGRRGPAHGDCAPWNLLRTGRGWWLVDWADATLDAPPFEDLFHHLVQSMALLGRPRRDELLAGIAGRGPIAELVHRYAHGAGLPVTDVRPLFLDHLHRTAATLDLDAEDGRAGRRARVELLEALEPGGRG